MRELYPIRRFGGNFNSPIHHHARPPSWHGGFVREPVTIVTWPNRTAPNFY